MSGVVVPVLREKQQKLVNDLRVALRTNKRVLAVAHTAFGKTVTFSYIAAGAIKKGSRILIMAHRKKLIQQIGASLNRFGINCGYINPHYNPAYMRQVQVATVGTLYSRLKKIPAKFRKFDLVILDEAHHLVESNTFGKVFRELGSPLLIGFTATAERGDGTGLGEGEGGVFQVIVLGSSVKESIDDGFLSPFKVYAPANGPIDVSGVKITTRGDYDKKALADRVDKPKVTGDAVKEWERHAKGMPTVVFCVSIEHCNHVAEAFRSAGYDFRVIHGDQDIALQDELIDGLGKTHIGLVACDLISEGVDVPSIACALFMRPTKSLGLYIQQAGRAIRPVYREGADLSTREARLRALATGPKPHAILLDMAGLCFTHGLIDEEREWSLEGRKKKGKGKKKDEEPVALKSCKKCFVVFAPAPVCPHCGEPVEVQSRQVEHVDGELAEITPEMRSQLSRERRKEQGKAQSLDDLRRIAAQRGYSEKWADKVYEARQRKRAGSFADRAY